MALRPSQGRAPWVARPRMTISTFIRPFVAIWMSGDVGSATRPSDPRSAARVRRLAVELLPPPAPADQRPDGRPSFPMNHAPAHRRQSPVGRKPDEADDDDSREDVARAEEIAGVENDEADPAVASQEFRRDEDR